MAYGSTPEERDILSTVSELRDDGGLTWEEIAIYLNAKTYQNAHGRPWRKDAVRKLHNENIRESVANLVSTRDDVDERMRLSLAVLEIAASGSSPKAKEARACLDAYKVARDEGLDVQEATKLVACYVREARRFDLDILEAPSLRRHGDKAGARRRLEGRRIMDYTKRVNLDHEPSAIQQLSLAGLATAAEGTFPVRRARRGRLWKPTNGSIGEGSSSKDASTDCQARPVGRAERIATNARNGVDSLRNRGTDAELIRLDALARRPRFY